MPYGRQNLGGDGCPSNNSGERSNALKSVKAFKENITHLAEPV